MGNSPYDSPALSPAPVADLAEQMDISERSKYIKGKKIGSGQYADVFEATLATDRSKLFAIKKIKIAAESADVGISYDSLREIRFLQELSHPNIIKLHAVFSTKDQNLNLVLEHLPQGDLLVLVQDVQGIADGEELGDVAGDIFGILGDFVEEDLEAGSDIIGAFGILEQPVVHGGLGFA